MLKRFIAVTVHPTVSANKSLAHTHTLYIKFAFSSGRHEIKTETMRMRLGT